MVHIRIFYLIIIVGVLSSCTNNEDEAMALFAAGEYQAASVMFEKALKLYPNDWNLWYNYGRCLQELEEYRESIQAFAKSLSLNKENDKAYFSRGLSYFRLNEPELAIVDFRNTLRRNNRHFQAQLMLGRSYSHIGEHMMALNEINKAIEIDKDYIMCYYYTSC